MRIITGIRKGMKISAPDGLTTRPTESRIKESLFNILWDVSGSVVLDMFAGSGSIGLEFLSRGAEKVYFIEKEISVLKVLEKNIENFKTDDAIILKGDFQKFLKEFSKNNITFDYIYIDPPYNAVQLYETALKFIYEYELINKNGTIILETSENVNFKNLEKFEIKDIRKYRSTVLYFAGRK